MFLTKKATASNGSRFSFFPLVLLCKEPDSSRVSLVLRKLLPCHKLKRLAKYISNKLVIKRRKYPHRRQYLSLCHLHYHTQPKLKSRLVLHNLNKLLNHIISLIKVNNKSQLPLKKAHKGPVRLSCPALPSSIPQGSPSFPLSYPLSASSSASHPKACPSLPPYASCCRRRSWLHPSGTPQEAGQPPSDRSEPRNSPTSSRKPLCRTYAQTESRTSRLTSRLLPSSFGLDSFYFLLCHRHHHVRHPGR